MKTRTLFVAGSTGAVGRALLTVAAARHVEVVPHVRPRSASKLTHPSAAVFELDEPQLTSTLRACTTVVQLIGTMRSRFRSGDTYETSDIGTTRLLLSAARAAGVDHFVLLSSVGAGRPWGAYLRAKAEAEQLVRTSGLEHTIFRPSAFEDRSGGAMPLLRGLTAALGLRRIQPIKVEELARAIVQAAVNRAPLGVVEGASLWSLVAAAPP